MFQPPVSASRCGKFSTRLRGGTLWSAEHLVDWRHQRAFLMQLAECSWKSRDALCIKSSCQCFGKENWKQWFLNPILFVTWFKFYSQCILLFFFQICPQSIANNKFEVPCVTSSLYNSPPCLFLCLEYRFPPCVGSFLSPAALQGLEPPEPPWFLTKEALCWTWGMIKTCRFLGAFLKLFLIQKTPSYQKTPQ